MSLSCLYFWSSILNSTTKSSVLIYLVKQPVQLHLWKDPCVDQLSRLKMLSYFLKAELYIYINKPCWLISETGSCYSFHSWDLNCAEGWKGEADLRWTQPFDLKVAFMKGWPTRSSVKTTWRLKGDPIFANLELTHEIICEDDLKTEEWRTIQWAET